MASSSKDDIPFIDIENTDKLGNAKPSERARHCSAEQQDDVFEREGSQRRAKNESLRIRKGSTRKRSSHSSADGSQQLEDEGEEILKREGSQRKVRPENLRVNSLRRKGSRKSRRSSNSSVYSEYSYYSESGLKKIFLCNMQHNRKYEVNFLFRECYLSFISNRLIFERNSGNSK